MTIYNNVDLMDTALYAPDITLLTHTDARNPDLACLFVEANLHCYV